MRKGPLDPIPHLIVTILAFAAQMEAQAITERNRETRAYMRQIGRWPGGMHPYHTKPEEHGNGWRLAHNPDTAPVMRDIIERVMRGDSKRSIADSLNARGIPSPREYRVVTMKKETKAPVAGTVRITEARQLTLDPDDGAEPVKLDPFPKSAGWAVEDGEHVNEGQRLTLPLLWNSKTIRDQCVARALLGEVEFQGRSMLNANGEAVKRCDPLVNRDEWTVLQRRIAAAAEPYSEVKPSDGALLLGTAFCALCGERMYMRNQGARPKLGLPAYSYYGCRSAWGYLNHETKATRCKARGVSLPDLEATVERMLMANVGDLLVLKEVVRAGESHREELQAAQAALADLLERAAGKPEAVQVIYRAQIEAVEARVAKLAAMPETEERIELASTGMTYRQIWERADQAERRRLVTESDIRVEVARTSGDAVKMGLFQRPERYDQAVMLDVSNGVQAFMYLPRDLAERVGAGAGVVLSYGEPVPLF